MTERWRTPAKIAAVEEDPNRIYHDGNVYRRQIDVTYDGPTLARMRMGYLCFRCMEPQERPMPTACVLCGYDMAEYQARDLALEFEGEKHIGPSTSLDDEVAAMREKRERAERGTHFWTPPNAA